MGETLPGGAEAVHWHALRVKPRHEKSVAKALAEKGLAQLLPLYRSRRRWSDRIKVVELPLFPGYVFCQFGREQELPVLQTPGVLNVVAFGGQPAPVLEEEIQSLRTIVDSQTAAEPAPYLRTGQLVCVTQGALAGVRGFLQQLKNKTRLVISVQLLQRSITVELDTAAVVPVDPRAPESTLP